MADLLATFRPYHGRDNPQGLQSALLSSAKLLRAAFQNAKCDDEGVACCIRCNVMFLVRNTENVIAALNLSSETGE